MLAFLHLAEVLVQLQLGSNDSRPALYTTFSPSTGLGESGFLNSPSSRADKQSSEKQDHNTGLY